MKTLITRYCAENRCDEATFHARVFWACLHRRTLPFVFLFGGRMGNYFSADRALIAQAARAEKLSQIAEDIAAFGLEPDNTQWIRKTARMRLSGRRLQRLARRYLAPQEASGSERSAPRCDTLGGKGA